MSAGCSFKAGDKLVVTYVPSAHSDEYSVGETCIVDRTCAGNTSVLIYCQGKSHPMRHTRFALAATAESPDDWVTQDEVESRPGIDEYRWVFKNCRPFNWVLCRNTYNARHGYVDKVGDRFEVRCRRRDLPSKVNDWVIQDRVTQRAGIDECRWVPTDDSLQSHTGWVPVKDNDLENIKHGDIVTPWKLEVRCLRKDLPELRDLPAELPLEIHTGGPYIASSEYSRVCAQRDEFEDQARDLFQEITDLKRAMSENNILHNAAAKELADARTCLANEEASGGQVISELQQVIKAQREALSAALNPGDTWKDEIRHISEQRDIAVALAAEQHKTADALTVQLNEARNDIEALKKKLADAEQLNVVPQQNTVTDDSDSVIQLKRPEFPSWLNPEWWAAMDVDGAWWVHKNLPHINEEEEIWDSPGRAYMLKNEDYTDSMRAVLHKHWRLTKWRIGK